MASLACIWLFKQDNKYTINHYESVNGIIKVWPCISYLHFVLQWHKIAGFIHCIGFPKKKKAWLGSSLRNRQQCVQLNHAVSGLKEVICGAPQGSVTAPNVCILHTNYIMNVTFPRVCGFWTWQNWICSGKILHITWTFKQSCKGSWKD